MTSLTKKIAVIGISAAVLATSFLSAEAMPVTARPEIKSDVQTVQYWQDRDYRGGYNRDGYYGGYRGYRERREGYRHHNGYWFPLAAFAAGALIGGAVAAQPRYVAPAPRYVAPARSGINPRHYEYCAGRYRSYDSYSNTFQPNHGPRQQCYSPFY